MAKPKPVPKLFTLYVEIPFGDKTRSNILEPQFWVGYVMNVSSMIEFLEVILNWIFGRSL